MLRGHAPVIARGPGLPDVYVSVGHLGKGILPAPLSGELLLDELPEYRPRASAAFRPDRFPVTERVGEERRHSHGSRRGRAKVGHGVPVDDVVEGLDVVRPAVLGFR